MLRTRRTEYLAHGGFALKKVATFPCLSRRFPLPLRAVAERFGAEFVDFDPADLPFSARSPGILPFGVHGWPRF